MSENKTEKIVYIVTRGCEHAEMVSLPFVLGVAALAMDIEVVVALQAEAVRAAVKGCAETVFAPGLPPLKKLMDQFHELGGTLLICTPCIEHRQIERENLVDGHEMMAAARLTEEILKADAVVTY
jgi:uncharacterized protein